MPRTAESGAAPAPAAPALALKQWSIAERKLSAWPNLHWSDTDEGGRHVDLVPNPKRWLIAEDFGLKVAMDCGEPGIHI